MNKVEFFDAINALCLPPEEFVVIGAGVLGALDIREVDDVDLILSEREYEKLARVGEWDRHEFDDGCVYLSQTPYEIGLSWGGEDASPNLVELKSDELVIEGVPFISLARLLEWKAWKGREKDLQDIELIRGFSQSR